MKGEVPAKTERLALADLPEEIQQQYMSRRNISKLYDWQVDCLSDSRLLRGANMVISLPTGAGKTLVAEVLMLRESVVHGRSSILVLPYVAIVQEKMTSLSVFEDSFGIHIEEYAASKGRLPPIKRRRGNSIYVATIEKANMLINSLIENDALRDIGLVVVDETCFTYYYDVHYAVEVGFLFINKLHMIGDGRRGSLIESLVTKFMYKGRGQVVGMSATLSNMTELSRFLNAFVYSTNFRPVALQEMVRIGPRLLRVSQPSGSLVFHSDMPYNKFASKDPDGICQLLQGFIPHHSVIIFCPTKKSCENVALLIASMAPRGVRHVKSAERATLIQQIKEEGDGSSDSNLEKCMRSGVAWHHSGLTHDERKLIEAAYVAGTLCVLCATSTLAAGVNLPARRVIIKAPMVGRDKLKKSQYLQMIGRAGRAGFDEIGEAVTILRPGSEEDAFRCMLQTEEMHCVSGLIEEKELATFLLDCIALKIISSTDELEEVVGKLLLSIQCGHQEASSLSNAALESLKKEQLVSQKGEVISSTEVGAAVFGANVHPVQAGVLKRDLVSSLSAGMVFSSHLHLLFIIAPYDISCNVDWDLYFKEFRSLPQCEQRLLEVAGVPMQRILAQIMLHKNLKEGESAMRLYIALMMQHVWNQESQQAVAALFSVERGWLQSALQACVAHAAAIAKFSERLPSMFWPLRLLLPELVSRLSDCAKPELQPLMAVDLVKKRRAAQLHAAGYKTVASIARAEPSELVRDIENLGRYQASKIIQSAKSILRDELDVQMEQLAVLGMTKADLTAALAPSI